MDWISNKPIAHRGLHNGSSIPENSILAFEEAIRKNYPIELDVNLMADDELAVFHDQNLKRMTGIDGQISSCNSSKIKNYSLLSTAYRIPIIDEVLELVNGRVPILIEIKNEGSVGKLESILLEKLSSYSGEYAIQSFNPFSVAWFKKNAPYILRGQLASDFKSEDLEWHKKFLLKNLLLNRFSSPHFIAYDIRALPNPAVSIVRNLFRMPIIGWTIRTEQQRDKYSKYSDNIIFEYIEP